MVTRAQPALAPNGTGHWWPSKCGPENEAGVLNEITPGKVLEAVRLVRRGQVYERGSAQRRESIFSLRSRE